MQSGNESCLLYCSDLDPYQEELRLFAPMVELQGKEKRYSIFRYWSIWKKIW